MTGNMDVACYASEKFAYDISSGVIASVIVRLAVVHVYREVRPKFKTNISMLRLRSSQATFELTVGSNVSKSFHA